MSNKIVCHHRFIKKFSDVDHWPEVKKAIEENFPEILDEDSILVSVTHESRNEVRFDVHIEARNRYSFGTLYDMFLRTHDLTI